MFTLFNLQGTLASLDCGIDFITQALVCQELFSKFFENLNSV